MKSHEELLERTPTEQELSPEHNWKPKIYELIKINMQCTSTEIKIPNTAKTWQL